jgi:hypothetical protein
MNADGKGLDRLADWLRIEIATETSQHRKKKKLKRLKVVDALRTPAPRPTSEPPRVDDHGRGAGDPAGPPSPGAPGRGPLRHLRPERPVSACHQPEQPVEEAHRHACAGGDPPEREAHAPGGRGRALRQRPPLQGHPGSGQAPAEVPQRHAEGEAGALPSEPPREAGGLLGSVGDRGGAGAEAAPVWPAQGHGGGALQAVHHPRAGEAGRGRDGQAGQEDRGAGRCPRSTRSWRTSSRTTRCS